MRRVPRCSVKLERKQVVDALAPSGPSSGDGGGPTKESEVSLES